mgnify:CR=1 FL=1
MTSATEELLTRSVEHIVPRSLAEAKLASGKPMRVYMGIDPTGTKLHLGHSVPLRKMQTLVEQGHHVIFLIGSFTAMIGDPSGRDKMREPLTSDQIVKNFEDYKRQASLVLDFDSVEMRFNHEWLEKMDGKLMMELASHFTVQQMLERDMFEKRMTEGNPISIVEFLYPLLVGYDSIVLDVDCELGGSDQLFNMLAGRTLQKAYGKRDKFVLTTKLIEGTDGRKMSKTYNNCIWMTDSPSEMYGKTMSLKDSLITTYLECCTNVPMQEVEQAKKRMASGGNPRDEKMILAREIVTLYHGAEAAAHAESEFTKIFAEKTLPQDIPSLRAARGSLLSEVLVTGSLVSSKGEARRLIRQGGMKHNDVTVSDTEVTVEEGIYKIGKRKFVRVIIQE